MKRNMTLIAVLALFVSALVPAQTVTPAAKQAAAKKTVSAVCPVMGTVIPDVSKAAAKSVYKGKTYYFCCRSCKAAFDKNPEKYLKNKELACSEARRGASCC